MFVGLGAVLYFVWFESDGATYQHVQRAEFAKAVANKSGPPASNKSPAEMSKILKRAGSALQSPRDARAFAQLTIPSVKLDVIVREGVDNATLRLAVGHLEQSAMPGAPGNSILFGHRDTFFRPLRDLKTGDIAEVRTTTGLFRYRIDDIKVVGPQDLDVTQPLDRAALTLITCFPFSYIGPSPRRYVARGFLLQNRQ